MENFNLFKDKISYSDLRQYMLYVKYSEIHISEFRFSFFHKELNRVFILHNPDLNQELYSYQIEQVIEELKEAGLYNEKCT